MVYEIIVSKGDKFFVAKCKCPDVVSQGRTLILALYNLAEAILLYEQEVKK